MYARRMAERPVLTACLVVGCALAGAALLPSCGNDKAVFPTSSSTGAGRGGAGGASGATGTGGVVATSSSTVTASSTSASSSTGSGAAPAGTVRVLTSHNDNARTGANLQETQLTTSNVSVSTFGLIFKRPVDGEIYAQPLVLPGVSIPGQGVHDVVFVATMNDSVYAFDAADPAADKPLWSVSFLDPANGVTPVDHTDVGWACGTYMDISGHIGILSTPVIDEAAGTIYVVAKTKENVTDQVYRLHALDLTTGAERPGSPVVLSAQVPGEGDGSQGGMIAFDPVVENQRPAITLANGLVYIAFSAYCDTGLYHGWVLGYDAKTLAQQVVFNDTPGGEAGGIWMSGQGLSIDEVGDVYLLTGNGTFDGNIAGGTNFGSTFLKLSPDLGVIDWFTPYNVEELNEGDLDLGSSGALLVPGTSLAIGGGKGGYLYVLDRGDLGHWNSADDSQIVQSIQVTNAHIHGSPIVWDLPTGKLVYVWGEYGHLNGYQLMGTQLQQVGQSAVVAPDGMPGGMLSLSANGTTPGTGIVWATHPLTGDANQAVRPGILQAFDAADLTKVLWDSQQNAGRDDFGNFGKFAPPTVANGKVYLATFSNQLAVYGLADYSGPCYNGVQDPGETGVDCGGPCSPCTLHTTTCAPPAAMTVGDSFLCDLGTTRTVTGVALSVGCTDGETGTFKFALDQPPAPTFPVTCNSTFVVGPAPSRYVTTTMESGGGADNHISVQSFTVTHY